jgi:hypothetical protein
MTLDMVKDVMVCARTSSAVYADPPEAEKKKEKKKSERNRTHTQAYFPRHQTNKKTNKKTNKNHKAKAGKRTVSVGCGEMTLARKRLGFVAVDDEKRECLLGLLSRVGQRVAKDAVAARKWILGRALSTKIKTILE